MRNERRGWVLFAVVAMLMPAAASAATIGAEVFGAYNSYAMDDVNDGIEAANAGGANFDELNGALTMGLGLRMWATPSWAFSAAWEPLNVETKSDVTNSKQNFDANSFQFTAARFFPSQTKARYGIGAGIGYYSISGEIEDPSLTPTIQPVEGTGVGFHFMGLGEYQVSPGFAVTGAAGYRIADISDLKQNDTDVTYTANYSGFMGRVGLAFYLPSHN